MNWSWLLPETASTFGPELDRMYYVILIITGVVFVATELLLVYFLWKYRHREGRRADPVHGNVKAEIVWTAVPFLIVLSIAFASRGSWDRIKNPANTPPDAWEVRVVASQFEWNATYAGSDGALDTSDDFTVRNRLFVPVDRAVKVQLRSEDVIHSFFLPQMRVKQDVVPGMEISVWFQPTQTGDFTIGCAELCGLGHTRMMGTLTVQSAAEHQTWLSEQQIADQTP
jgi:cytochrome c oxidase subunit 2